MQSPRHSHIITTRPLVRVRQQVFIGRVACKKKNMSNKRRGKSKKSTSNQPTNNKGNTGGFLSQYLGGNPLAKKEHKTFYNESSMYCSACNQKLNKKHFLCKCEFTRYCNFGCQRAHWKVHKSNHKMLIKKGNVTDGIVFAVGDLAMYKHDKKQKRKGTTGTKEIVVILAVHGTPTPTHFTMKVLDSQFDSKRQNTAYDVTYGDKHLQLYHRPETTQRMLFESCANGFTDVIEALVHQKGINLNQTHVQHENQPTALHVATWANNVDIVQILVNAPSININMQTEEGATPLYIACHSGHLEIVKILCAQVDQIDYNLTQQNGCTPLFCACDLNFTDIVDHLLSFPKVNVNQINHHDRTPLIQASYRGQSPDGQTNELVIRALLAHPNIDITKTVGGATAIQWAQTQNHQHVITEFYSYICRNHTDREDYMPGFVPKPKSVEQNSFKTQETPYLVQTSNCFGGGESGATGGGGGGGGGGGTSGGTSSATGGEVSLASCLAVMKKALDAKQAKEAEELLDLCD